MFWRTKKKEPAGKSVMNASTPTSSKPSRGEETTVPTPPAPEPVAKSTEPDAPAYEGMQKEIISAIRTVYDPEIPVNVYDIGLVYDIDITAEKDVRIRMTLTSPNCPEAEIIPVKVEQAVKTVDGVNGCKVAIVWDPPWTPDQLSEAARLELGML